MWVRYEDGYINTDHMERMVVCEMADYMYGVRFYDSKGSYFDMIHTFVSKSDAWKTLFGVAKMVNHLDKIMGVADDDS